MSGPINWLSQVGSVTKFGLLGIPQRRGSVAAAVFGIAGVVGVLVGVLSIAAGFLKTMRATGAPDVAFVLRSGADSEMVSGLSLENTRVIADAPGIARDDSGALASPELFVIINLPKRPTGTDANVPLRGVEQAAYKVRDGFQIVEGRRFTPGKNEVIVGTGAAREFLGLDVGGTISVGHNSWQVVGRFSAAGSAAESEIWTDAAVLQDAYHRGDSFQSVTVRLAAPAAFKRFKDWLTSNPQVDVQVMRLTDHYVEQSTGITKLIKTVGYIIAVLMGVGAVFGALNTMYGSVSARTREIATLRALGFGRSAVIAAVMLESIVLALVGGGVGACVAYFAFNGFESSTMNWQSFSQVTFAFAVTRALLVQGVLAATLIGMVGGFLPALRAATLPIASALREL